MQHFQVGVAVWRSMAFCLKLSWGAQQILNVVLYWTSTRGFWYCTCFGTGISLLRDKEASCMATAFRRLLWYVWLWFVLWKVSFVVVHEWHVFKDSPLVWWPQVFCKFVAWDSDTCRKIVLRGRTGTVQIVFITKILYLYDDQKNSYSVWLRGIRICAMKSSFVVVRDSAK